MLFLLLTTQTFYKVTCSYGAPYIGETRHSFNARINEHGADIKHECVLKSILAEHSWSAKHHICLESTKILFKENNFFKRKLKESIRINNHPSILNCDDGWNLSLPWQPLLSSIRKPSSKSFLIVPLVFNPLP